MCVFSECYCVNYMKANADIKRKVSKLLNENFVVE